MCWLAYETSSFIKISWNTMFITAVCVIFLIRLITVIFFTQKWGTFSYIISILFLEHSRIQARSPTNLTTRCNLLHGAPFPASRGSFPGVRWRQRTPGKEPLLAGKALQFRVCLLFSTLDFFWIRPSLSRKTSLFNLADDLSRFSLRLTSSNKSFQLYDRLLSDLA